MKLYESVIKVLLLSALLDVSLSLKCADCTGSERICYKEVHCSDGKVCYTTKERHHSRGYIYESGCGSREWHCGEHSHHSSHGSHSWSHGSLLGSGRETKCCDSSDMCNTHLTFSTDSTTTPPPFQFTKGTTDATTTPPNIQLTEGNIDTTTTPPNIQLTEGTTDSTTTPTPFQLTKGIECQVCSGPTCGVKGDDPVIKCPDEFPHCMNVLLNEASGKTLVTKRCAKREECQAKVNDACMNFNLSKLDPHDMWCIYCCKSNGCNGEIVPKAETLVFG